MGKMKKVKNIFNKKDSSSSRQEKEKTDDDSGVPVIEVAESSDSHSIGEIQPIIVKSMDLDSIVDVEKITSEIQTGNIVIVNITPLMDDDPSELKRAVNQIRDYADEMGGDIGRLSESRIICTPQLVKIQFRSKEK